MSSLGRPVSAGLLKWLKFSYNGLEPLTSSNSRELVGVDPERATFDLEFGRRSSGPSASSFRSVDTGLEGFVGRCQLIRFIADYFRIVPTPGSTQTGKSLQ